MSPTFPVRSARLLTIAVALGVLSTAAAPGVIRVRRGDTLSELARRHGTTVQALRALNRLGGNNLIFEGQTLRISRVPASAAATTRRPTYAEVVHVVASGDSLISIARRYRQTPDGVAKRNRLPKSRVVRLGQHLVVGSRRISGPTADRPAGVRRGAPKAVPREQVRSLIVREARRRKVDPYLAVALAWQESGLQHDVLSSTGALGAMQVMPATGQWVSRYLAKRPLDLYDVEDNVEAGVRYLAQLLKVAPSTDAALAGYYQGLRSVTTRGMLAETKRYVGNIVAIRRRLADRRRPRT